MSVIRVAPRSGCDRVSSGPAVGKILWKSITSWWFQPFWKICSSNWIISPHRDINKKYLKPPPRLHQLVQDFVHQQDRCQFEPPNISWASGVPGFPNTDPSRAVWLEDLGWLACGLFCWKLSNKSHQMSTWSESGYKLLVSLATTSNVVHLYKKAPKIKILLTRHYMCIYTFKSKERWHLKSLFPFKNKNECFSMTTT